ncbi:MAG TPA: hypothetical protein VGE45_00300 [Chloroflexia bacterium]|jgi:hypothetical protein
MSGTRILSCIEKYDDHHVIVRNGHGTSCVPCAPNMERIGRPTLAEVASTPSGLVLTRIVSDAEPQILLMPETRMKWVTRITPLGDSPVRGIDGLPVLP